MKLNESAPGQHLAILIGGGVIVFLNILSYLKAPETTDPNAPVIKERIFTEQIDSQTGEVRRTETLYRNPSLSWFDRLFCRGLHRSSNCNEEVKHPIEDQEELGLNAPQADKKVLYYRGDLKQEKSADGKIETPMAVQPQDRLLRPTVNSESEALARQTAANAEEADTADAEE